MRVTIDPGAGSVRLDEVDDLDHFAVHAPAGCAADDVGAALRRADAGIRIGDVGDHCWIAVSFVRTAARRSGDTGWNRRFDAMLTYAGSRGWLDESRDRILAHIEWFPASG